MQVRPQREAAVDLARLRERLSGLGECAVRDGMLVVAIEGGLELSVFPDGRAIVRGTTSLDVARGVYARCVGE